MQLSLSQRNDATLCIAKMYCNIKSNGNRKSQSCLSVMPGFRHRNRILRLRYQH
ncbi:hypothetical protein UUU_44980 [Klebsiella pneumoniae subsp. pneumoniae DSM 30104 = JCM 1662 = NBRC 14940]|nr:hypothetical protein UUU_44980 [Klebsiella pneumoniae subsp. pneumoniae DSM 30104 = JCM 1662 = NBRC 14940]